MCVKYIYNVVVFFTRYILKYCSEVWYREYWRPNAIHELISDGISKEIPKGLLIGIHDPFEEIMKTFLMFVIQCFKIFQKSFPVEF